MCVDDLNAMALKVGVICLHRLMREQLTCMPNCTPLSFRGHQNSAILQIKASLNAGMAKLVNLYAGMDLARGERCEGVKKGCIKKQNTRLNFYVINMIIGRDLKCVSINETIFG